jgi:flavin reductase (DIM6/NTAB) family NADH-FMN oxidoreductase RutF
VDTTVDPGTFRRAMSRLPTGVTVLTTRSGEHDEVMTANAVMSVSLEPVLLAVSIKAPSRWFSALTSHGSFAVNVLAEHHELLSRWAASSARHATTEPLAGWDTTASEFTGCAHLTDASAVLDCTIDAIHGAGDHALVVGRVLAVTTTDLTRPLVFHASRYTTVGEASALEAEAEVSSAAG